MKNDIENQVRQTNTILHTAMMILMVLISIGVARGATFTVTNTNDSSSGSLREAVNMANAMTDSDNINFDAVVFASPHIITLTSGQLTVAGNSSLTIDGTGANRLNISGSNSRLFLIFTGGNLQINSLTISNGATTGEGGGIFSYQGTLTLTNSVVGDNTSDSGSGIFNFQGSLTLTNSTVSNNTTRDSGGGITNLGGGDVVLINSTVSGNQTINGGGGFFSLGGGTISLTNSTVSDNVSRTGGDCSRFNGTITATYSLIGDSLNCVNGTGSNDNLTGNPLRGPLRDNGGLTQTHALLAGSPAIDAGNSLLTTDQRGQLRPFDDPASPNGSGNFSDIGAFEFQGAVPTDKNQCKNGGFKAFTFPRTFKNQGECIQFVNTAK